MLVVIVVVTIVMVVIRLVTNIMVDIMVTNMMVVISLVTNMMVVIMVTKMMVVTMMMLEVETKGHHDFGYRDGNHRNRVFGESDYNEMTNIRVWGRC